jgi:hypothetical protein
VSFLIDNVRFLKQQLTNGAVFIVVVGIAMYQLAQSNGHTFAVQWRWFHDSFLISLFWYLPPFVLTVFAIVLGVEKYTKKKLFDRLPAWFYFSWAFIVFLPFCSIFSQLCGGCIWFYFTEHWWGQFMPETFLWVTGPDVKMWWKSFYVFMTFFTYWFSFWFWQKAVYLSNKNHTLTTP